MLRKIYLDFNFTLRILMKDAFSLFLLYHPRRLSGTAESMRVLAVKKTGKINFSPGSIRFFSVCS